MSTFYFLKLLSQFAMPPGVLACGVVAAIVCALLRRRRLTYLALALGIAPSLLLSWTPIADAMMITLENQARREAAAAPACCYDYIVVLGAGVVTEAPPIIRQPQLADTSDRLWEAARLFKRGVAPLVIATGGSVGPAEQSEAHAMRAVLVDFGVPADRIILEAEALNTIENMRFVRGIVGDKRVALVTSAFHMPRALRLAGKAGLNVAAFPADWRVVPSSRGSWDMIVPSVDALWMASIALREHIALTFDRRGDSLKP